MPADVSTAIRAIEEVLAATDGIEIPEPRDINAYSGRFLLRIPRSLHAELAARAEEEGVSLNQYVAIALASAVSRRALGG